MGEHVDYLKKLVREFLKKEELSLFNCIKESTNTNEELVGVSDFVSLLRTLVSGENVILNDSDLIFVGRFLSSEEAEAVSLLRFCGSNYSNTPQVIKARTMILSVIGNLEKYIADNDKKIKSIGIRSSDIRKSIDTCKVIIDFLDKFGVEKVSLSSEQLKFLFDLILSSSLQEKEIISIINHITIFVIDSLNEKQKEDTSEFNLEKKREEYNKVLGKLSEIDSIKERILYYISVFDSYKDVIKIGNVVISMSDCNDIFDESKIRAAIDNKMVCFGLEESDRCVLEQYFCLSCLKHSYNDFAELFLIDEELEKYIEDNGVNTTLEDISEYVNEIIKLFNNLLEILNRMKLLSEKKAVKASETIFQQSTQKKSNMFVFLPSMNGTFCFDKKLLKLDKGDLKSVESVLKYLRDVPVSKSERKVKSLAPITCNADNTGKRSSNKKETIEILSAANIGTNNHFRIRQNDIRVGFIVLEPTGARKKQLESFLGYSFNGLYLIIDVWHENDKSEGAYVEHNDFVADNIKVIKRIMTLFTGSSELNESELEIALDFLKSDSLYDNFYDRVKGLS